MENNLQICRLPVRESFTFPSQEDLQSNVKLRGQETFENSTIPFSRDFSFHKFKPFNFTEECSSYGFKSQPKPWLPQTVKSKLERMKHHSLRNEELVSLLQEIADISIDFYSVEPGRCIAINLEGKVVESAETEFELLMKIQGRKLGGSVFVWKAGTKSFAGWTVWQR